MPIITYDGRDYECFTAIEGDDYVKLLDENGKVVAYFDGVVDTSLFKFTNNGVGNSMWYTTGYTGDCCIAVAGFGGAPVGSSTPLHVVPNCLCFYHEFEIEEQQIITAADGSKYYAYDSFICNDSINTVVRDYLEKARSDNKLITIRPLATSRYMYAYGFDTITEYITHEDFATYRYLVDHYVYTHIGKNSNSEYTLTPVFDAPLSEKADQCGIYLIFETVSYV